MANDLSKIGITGVIRPPSGADILTKMSAVAVMRTSGRNELTKVATVAVLRPGAAVGRRRALLVS